MTSVGWNNEHDALFDVEEVIIKRESNLVCFGVSVRPTCLPEIEHPPSYWLSPTPPLAG